jgi:hypothetical protein
VPSRAATGVAYRGARRQIHFAKKNNYHQFSFIVCRFALQRVWLLGA